MCSQNSSSLFIVQSSLFSVKIELFNTNLASLVKLKHSLYNFVKIM